MANMSAQILRNIVSSVFNIKPQEVILSGEISVNFNINGSSSYFTCGDKYSTDEFQIWSFHPKTGFTEIPTEHSYSCGSGERYEAPGVPLADVATGEEIFFLIKSTSWHGNSPVEELWTLYKAPNFQEHWAKIEKEDLERWESWLNPTNEQNPFTIEEIEKYADTNNITIGEAAYLFKQKFEELKFSQFRTWLNA